MYHHEYPPYEGHHKCDPFEMRKVQADWNQNDPRHPAFIFNKPVIPQAINGVKADKEGNVQLGVDDLGIKPISNHTIREIVKDVFGE